MTFLYFSVHSKCLDLIKQHIYFFSLSLFYLKDWVIVCEDQIFLLFPGLTNIVFILFYNFIEFIILFYTFLVISFAPYKECIICLISFSTFSDVLPAFTCARAISNLWNLCLVFWAAYGRTPYGQRGATRATWSEVLQSPFTCFLIRNIPLLKALRTFYLPLGSIIAFLRVFPFFSFLTNSFAFADSSEKNQYLLVILFVVQLHHLMMNCRCKFISQKILLF